MIFTEEQVFSMDLRVKNAISYYRQTQQKQERARIRRHAERIAACVEPELRPAYIEACIECLTFWAR
jgi:hypothetical protein